MLNNQIKKLKNPSLAQLPQDYESFINQLDCPTIIDIEGQYTNQWRVVVTLIHGNEPSGFIAAHRWLVLTRTYDRVPLTNIRFIIASVEAAQKSPQFSHRYLPQGKDLNRCFGRQQANEFEERANMLCEAIGEVAPELVVDLHNTSGMGPAFAVSVKDTRQETALASLFCQTLIYSDFRLGGLMEQEFNCPIVTIECGGSRDQQAHEVAFQGIDQLSRYRELDKCHHLQVVDVCAHPQRLNLKSGLTLSYGMKMDETCDLTLITDIEQCNFGITSKGRTLAWVKSNSLEDLRIITPEGNNVVEEYFEVVNCELIAKTNLRIFMATPVKSIALGDCLFYVLKSGEETTFNH